MVRTRKDGMTTMDNDDFRLSRIEAEGWSAAQRYMADETVKPDDIRVADFNPYGGGAARSRWAAGFRKAVATMGAK
jgi:hypothetical protein